MNVLFKGMTPEEIKEAAKVINNWSAHYKSIRPFTKVEIGKKWILWNTRTGNTTIIKK